MATTKPPKQLGAQRFYNAVKASNVGFVAMYVTSLRSGIVQGIDGVKVFEAWDATGNIEMLNVLLSVPELRSFKTYRRCSPPFGTAVLRKLTALTFDEAHAAEIRAYVQAFESTQCVLGYDALAIKLAAQIGSDATWPYATMAESRRLSELMLGLQYDGAAAQSVEVMDWYLDMFGVPKDLPKGELRQSIINLFQNKQWLQLEKLLPDVALRRQVFADNWSIGNPIKTAANGHQYYLELLRIAPWIKT